MIANCPMIVTEFINTYSCKKFEISTPTDKKNDDNIKLTESRLHCYGKKRKETTNSIYLVSWSIWAKQQNMLYFIKLSFKHFSTSTQ